MRARNRNNMTCLSPASAIIAMAIGTAAARAAVTWDGGAGGSGTAWNLSDNWDPDGLPGTADEVIFTNTGLSSGRVITLGAPHAIGQLTINATLGFTIGHTTNDTANALTLTTLTRASTTNAQTIAAPVTLSGTSQWTVNGAGLLTVSKSVGGGSGSLTKLGDGELRLGASSSFTGGISVLAGTLRGNAADSLRGSVTIGDNGVAATAITGIDNAFVGNGTVRVRANGLLDGGGRRSDWGRVNVLTVEAGGRAINLGNYYVSAVNVTADAGVTTGNVTGGTFYNLPTLRTFASNHQAKVTSNISEDIYTNPSINVENGGAAIDLDYGGLISGGATDKTLTKSNGGTLLLSRAGGHTHAMKVVVSAGTLLAGNTSGSATGSNTVTVNGGATLGGTGIIGGVSGYANANVTLAGGSSSSRATLDPGSLDAVTGVPTIESLTVGGAGQSNNVTFGNFSTLHIDIGNTNAADLLEVGGTLNLASAGGTDALSIRQLPDTSVLAGDTYVLADFDLLVGRFNAATYNGGALDPTWEVIYTGTPTGVGDQLANGQILLHIPEPSSVAIVGMGAIAFMRRRRR